MENKTQTENKNLQDGKMKLIKFRINDKKERRASSID